MQNLILVDGNSVSKLQSILLWKENGARKRKRRWGGRERCLSTHIVYITFLTLTGDNK
jgi:hypothetical protein